MIGPSDRASQARNVVAVLGPTNTGKTHLAIERMLAHSTGVIGLPLRLLAREVYQRIVERAGVNAVQLITGEEKILPAGARYRVCTVEAMPSEVDASFLAIDEIQIAADLERGHVFTDRILNLRGRDETLLLGAATMRGVIEKLVPTASIVTRPRMSVLSYAGQKKITRLPRRSAVVAFSADEVYAIAELIRRQRGGAAVVLGALSPRTRNAQVEIFQSGDVDFLVATDAIGMGLNLDVDHVAFASDRKFDGYQYRRLTAAELGQVAGRAGRHMRDGTFGVTGAVEPFEDSLVEALETHRFEPVKTVQWRNRDLDFSTLDALKASLDRAPRQDGLVKAPPAEDVTALEIAAREDEVARLADRPARVALLWDVCQMPDYRRIAPANHADLVATLFRYLARDGTIDDDWFGAQVAYADRTDGDIDTLANRIAHIRTWTFAANRPQWLKDPAHWQERTRAIEDRLSDALHERLTQRFIDRRTSVLMRRLRENGMLEAEIDAAGDVHVEEQHVGRLEGFRFAPDPSADGPDGKALRAAAQKALAGEIASRAERLQRSENPDFILSSDGLIRWRGATVARIVEGDEALKPRLILLADDLLAGAAREAVEARLNLWLANHCQTLLKPLFDLAEGTGLVGEARGIAFRLVERLGVIARAEIADEVKALDQDMRAGLRQCGVRFGAYHIFVPALLKPAPCSLLALLFALKHGGFDQPGLAELPQLAASGRTSIPVDPAISPDLYRVAGYRVAGNRAVRLDILERLADIIRPILAWRSAPGGAPAPEGAFPGGGFTVTVAMTSLTGCAGEDFASILKSLGYRMERRPAPAKAEPIAAPVEASQPPAEGSSSETLSAEEMPVEAVAVAPESASVPVATDMPVEPVVGEAPPADVQAAEAEAAAPVPAEAQTETPAEPAMVEVWRPGRSEGRRPDRRPDHRQGRPQRDRRPHGAEAVPAGASPPEAGEERGEERKGAGRPRHGKGRPRRDDRRPERQDGRQDHREERRADRDDRRQGKGRNDAPPRRREEKPIDPDSPFAALAALKADLEARRRNR